MRRELAIEFSRVTEAAALAGYKWLGRGDKNIADGAAVAAMRHILNQIQIDGEIVIGEGEIDEAPMLYIGEKVGTGQGDAVDIAVDPIEGTRMTAMGQSNALAVLAVESNIVAVAAANVAHGVTLAQADLQRLMMAVYGLLGSIFSRIQPMLKMSLRMSACWDTICSGEM